MQLKQPLEEVGYCINPFNASLLMDSTVADELVLALSMVLSVTQRQETPSDSSGMADSQTAVRCDTTARMTVALLRVDSWSPRELKKALASPLLSLAYGAEELSTFESVLMRKIVENLRMQYICHLRIQSVPEGVTIRSKRGLEGTTPLEWITPVGKLPITGELEGYEPIRRRIDLSSPGMHTYVIEMSKRRFYHSKFFVPTLVLGVSSAACYVVDRVYYDKYRQLGREERENEPDLFARDFTIAKNFERAAAATLGIAGVSLTMCFIF